MDWFYKFPEFDNAMMTAFKRAVDDGFRGFTRAYGQTIESLFSPLQWFLIQSERFMLNTPWPFILLLILGLVFLGSRSVRITCGALLAFALIGALGMWPDAMKTVSLIFVGTVVAIVVGIPIGILMAMSDRLRRLVVPILDVMQTLPSFVYLLPVVMLLGIGRVPGLIAVVIYAVPPVIRLTDLGIRQVDRDVLEAADAFGSSRWQKLKDVQFPLAMPTIMAGINQTIMMALAMVVIASMIGVQGLGQPVLRAIQNQYFTLGLFNGMAVVFIAIVFDRASQAFGRNLQKHLEVVHG